MRALTLLLFFYKVLTFTLDSELASFPVNCGSGHYVNYLLHAFKSKCGQFVYAPFVNGYTVKMLIFHVESKAIIYKSFSGFADINTSTTACNELKMSRTLREPHRIYIESDYDGIKIGYITVKEGTAEFTAKTTVVDRSNHGSSIIFQSFHKNDVYFYKHLYDHVHYSSLAEISYTSYLTRTELYYPREVCIDHSGASSYSTFTKYTSNRSVKTISIFYDGHWYMPVIDITENDSYCGSSSCTAKDHMLMIYYSQVAPASNPGDYTPALDYHHCVGRQHRDYDSNSPLFEFGEGKGQIIVFAVANRDHYFDGDTSYIEYTIFSCSSNQCSKYRRNNLLSYNGCTNCTCSTSCMNNCTYCSGNCICGNSYNTNVLEAKKDSGNPYVFYLKLEINGTNYNRQYIFNRDGTIYNYYQISDSYGFSMPVGTTVHPTYGYTYNLFFMGYFDAGTNRFKIGFKVAETNYKNNDDDVFFRFDEGTYSYYYPDQYKVTHNDGVALGYISYFYSHASGDEFGLNSPRSLRVSTGLTNKVLKDEARCNDEEDYVLIGDYFYYCVSTCSSYFSRYQLKTVESDDSCENKIVFTDFGKTKHRCVAGFVDDTDNCPDLMFNGSENYKFKYTSGAYTEYRYDCRGEYILKPTGDTITSSVSETGTCGTCDYGSKKVVEASNHLYYNDSNVQTTQKRKYCLDACDISPFLIIYQAVDGDVTKSYCTETCVAANSVTDVSVDEPYYDPADTVNQCKPHCPAARNYVTSDSSTASIAAILVKPVCNAACPDTTNYRVHEANFTDTLGNTVPYKYCLSTCTTDEKLFTKEHGTYRECITACPANEGFYYYLSSADPQYCVSVCPSSHPYITGHHTHTGPPSDITEGQCKSACDSSSHYKYEVTTGVYLCLEQCYPNPTVVDNSCSSSTCQPYRSFFLSDRICVKDCPTGNKHLQTFSGVLTTVTHESSKGYCTSDCPTNHFKYTNRDSTCITCPGGCTEAAVTTRIDSILAGTTSVADLNNGCTRVHCLASECHSDKPFFSSERICITDCPLGRKHLKAFTGIISTIEHNSIKGFCEANCGSNEFKYMNPTTTCTNCTGSCTEAAIATRIDSILAGTTTIADLNNGCTRVHCLISECHSDKPFFTSEKICAADCPPRRKHLRPFTGIISTIENNSAKGLCDSDCGSNEFKYMNLTTTCTNCPSSCDEAAVAARLDSILAGTTTVADLNNGCVRVHCMPSGCHPDKPFFTPEKICVTDCPPRNKHLNPFTGVVNSIQHNSAEGLCDTDCESTKFKYANPTTTCDNCPSSCNEAAIAALFAQVEAGSQPASFLNNLCARVHCMDECHSDKPFFTPNRLCYTLCPSSHPYVRKFTGIINKMEFNSTKGQCNTACATSEFIYFNTSTQNQNYCIDRCHVDKPYWDTAKICYAICPSHIPLVNPENLGSPFSVSMGEGICKSTCEAGFNFRYNIPDNTHQYFCLTQCETPKKYFVRYSTYSECVYECPFHLRYVHPTTNECLLSCPSSHPYYNSQGICLEKCDDYIYEWECAPSCKPGYNYVVQQGCSALCSKDIVGWNCLPYCPPAYPAQLNNYCAVSCLNNQFLDEVVNFKEPTEFGICKGGCSGYLIEGGVFSSGITKVYCVPACPELYMKEIRSPTERWCREECKIESQWKFTVLGDSCVSDCIALGYKYISEDYECLDNCSFFIDNEIWCVSKCPNERPFVYEQHCVEECPKNSRFVDDFTFCVPECESFNYDIFCVDRCDSAELATYYSERELNFKALPFVHSTLSCAQACDESGFEWINETNNQCVASCPLPCAEGVCPEPEMKYKEPTKYCRKECSEKEYSFTDKKSDECLAQCKAERRFFVEEDKLCLSSCPKEKPFIFEKTVCEDKGVCDTECNQIHSVCIAACPKEAIYTLKKKDEEYCLCACPQFYRPKPGTPVCELFCDEEKGLLPNSTEDSCNACRDDGLFLWQGECIRECPTGTLSNPFNSCRTCKQLNLWMDHTFKCVKFTDCSELSLFDYVNQICTRCDGEGMMVRKVFPGDFVCLKTECTDGHIIEGIINRCFVCPTGWFFSGETCFKTCPDKLFNDYNRFICTDNCFESCSDDCCVKGSCKIIQGKSECTCEEGFYGEKCDMTKEDLPKVVTIIQSTLINKLREGLFTPADTNALIEFYFYAKTLLSTRRQLVRVDPTLTANLRAFINESRIEFAFQPTILGLVDSLILIEKLNFTQTGQSTGFDSAISLLDTMTDDIQIFLTQNSEVGEFERIFEGKYRGQAFTFQFGTDIQEVTGVNVSKCIERIIEKENLTFGVKFPFKLLKFSSEVESSVTRTFPHAFNLSSTGKFELIVYKETGLYPLNEICLENYVDTTEQVTMEPEKKEASQKFANIGVNVFDITVPFFNDKCVPYESEDGKDLTLAERKAQLYKDPSELCAESAAKVCSVDGFSPEGEAICVCRGIQDQKKSSLQSIASTYPQTNYILITCYDTFRQSNIFRNVGFYVVFLSFIMFSSVGIRSIFYSDSEIHSTKRFTFIRNDVTFYEPDSMEIEIYFECCYTLKEKLSMHVIEISDKGELIRCLSEEEKEALFKVLPTVCDLKYLSFEQLLEFDRRSHFQFAIDTLIERNSLFNTFYLDSLTFPKYFRIMFFVTEFNLNIALNAFFIDDSLVESFNEQEETGFFYSLTNESAKTMWAFLTTKIIMIIFKFLYRVGKRNHDHLLRRMKSIEADYLKRAFNHFLLKMRFASLAFSFVAILFNLFCAYFVIVFCEIYKNSIDIWINGIYMGWIFDYLVLGGFVPLLLTGSRYLATKNSSLSFLYKLSNVVDVMLSLGLNN